MKHIFFQNLINCEFMKELIEKTSMDKMNQIKPNEPSTSAEHWNLYYWAFKSQQKSAILILQNLSVWPCSDKLIPKQNYAILLAYPWDEKVSPIERLHFLLKQSVSVTSERTRERQPNKLISMYWAIKNQTSWKWKFRSIQYELNVLLRGYYISSGVR